jgi:hypothetical protein
MSIVRFVPSEALLIDVAGISSGNVATVVKIAGVNNKAITTTMKNAPHELSQLSD